MSGPIVRKYGFPNFEKIFGAKPLLHGEPSPEPAEPIVPEATEPTKPVESPRTRPKGERRKK